MRQPALPYPENVVVPRQGEADPKASYEDLREAYTTSPARNPDGLGVFEAIEPRSRMTLWTGDLEVRREEANRIAYMRTPEQQAQVLDRVRTFHEKHVVFEGVLLSMAPEFTRAGWYMPEGIYLVDDTGRKFAPVAVEEGGQRSERLIFLPPVSSFGSTADLPRWVTGYPRIVFPGEAITPGTKAVTLYFAAAALRFAFTWVFDPAYRPAHQNLGPPAGRGVNRLIGPQ